MTNKAPEKIEMWFDLETNSDNTMSAISLNFEKPEYETGYHVISASYHDWKIAEMQKEIDELKEVLEFYANRDNYDWYINISLPPAVKDRQSSNVRMDYGKRARNALSKHKPKDQNDNT